LQPYVDSSETAVCLSQPFERNENLNLPAVGGEPTEDGSVGARIALRGEHPVEALVAEDHGGLLAGRFVDSEAIPRHGLRREAGGSVPIETCVNDRFGLQHGRFVREHLTSSSYTSVVHGLAIGCVIHFLLRTDALVVEYVSMKGCTHRFRGQQIGAGLVRRICERCNTISISERPRLGADPWGLRTEKLLSGSEARENVKALAG